ncbi:MAG: N-acetylmuramoyl-L-alanine amidase [Propionibacteriaceae bacterium]|jgi:hypothetical protein|nr:N-acetylmuramoyl-L-alanine amidase [Propionibacteriaceae bacterium]
MLPSEYGLPIIWKGSPNYTATRSNKVGATIHWIVGTLASADAAFSTSSSQVSAHYGVGPSEIHQYVDENYQAWHSGSTVGNASWIGIEHEGGMLVNGVRQPPTDAVLRLSGKLLGRLHHEWGWGRPVWGVTMKPHNDFSSTECPGTTDVAALTAYAQAEYDRIASEATVTPEPDTPSTSDTTEYHVWYKVRTQAHGWLPEVADLSDYAGWQESPITDVAMAVSAGTISYQVHVKGGSWLPMVTGYNTGDADNGYAGIGQPIDAVRAYYHSPNGDKVIRYRVAPVNGNWFDWQRDDETSNGQDGYAGALGYKVGKLQAEIAAW